jgi:hypothetical protein
MLQTKNTRIHNAENDLPVHRVELPEHFATEDSNVHLYVPKSQAKTVQHLVDRFRGNDELTSMQPRVQLPWISDNAVRNHAVMVTTTSASTIERQRSLAQLKTMAAAGNDDATAILASLKDLDFVIENDSTTVPFDASVQREWTGVWKRR